MIDLQKDFGDVVIKITVSKEEIERLSTEELADLIEWRIYKLLNERRERNDSRRH